MCVATPGKVLSIGEPGPASIPARVSIDGVERAADLIMVPEAVVGDFVVVHSGYAISVVPEERALGTLDLLGRN